jgi:hypothetical protein
MAITDRVSTPCVVLDFFFARNELSRFGLGTFPQHGGFVL